MEKLGKKLKHDHTLTSILKFGIFAMVMLAPIFSVASRCLYAICNKNAKDSYSDSYVEKVETLNSSNKTTLYVDGQIISYTFAERTSQWNSGQFGFSSISLNLNSIFNTETTWKSFVLYKDNANIGFYDINNSIYQLTATQRTFNKFTYQVYTANGNESTIYLFGLAQVYTYVQNTIDNAFEYSLSQLQESSYYNWATNLGIYTPIHNMVSGLGGHDIIALLLAYWSIYTAIYIVFDIIIVCFVKITHLIQGE